MLRAIWLTTQNEARLLVKDPIVLFMLLFAPVVIITVAGYSLGSLYGGSANSFRLPLVDLDHGKVAQGIVEALRREHGVALEMLDDPDEARRVVSRRDRTPIAMLIPAGTSAAVAAGGQPRLILFVDPVRRVEVDALELRIDELCRRVTEQARATAQTQIEDSGRDLREKIQRLSEAMASEQSEARLRFARTQAGLETSIRRQTAAALKQINDQTETIIKTRESQAWADVQQQLSQRQTILLKIRSYLTQLQWSQRAFEDWLAKLKTMAGRNASEIPPPPSFPTPISETELVELAEPVMPPKLDATLPASTAVDAFSISIPKQLELRAGNPIRNLESFQASQALTLPGDLGFIEQPATKGEAVVANAFDQYVPGFGITFLLIGMMLGLALTLFDERDWGTLKRLQVSGAPLTGLLLGKLFGRFIVGIAQMVLLFAVGWALFGISLGRNPLALIIPTVGISFAAAALGLVVASISTAHDSVMSLGVTISMAMAAIGGCWWPLDFEPGWMRELARWLPTTWTMQAFTDLMIRYQPPSAALLPLAATIGIGVIFIVAGLLRFLSLDD